MNYRLYNYELWGNKKDGYEVNNTFGTDTTIDIDPDDPDDVVIKKLRAVLSLAQKRALRRKFFNVEGGETPETFIWINYRDLPFCELRPEAGD
jgi:hypothetical protein